MYCDLLQSTKNRDKLTKIEQTVEALLVETVVSGSPGLAASETRLVRKRLKAVYRESTV